MFEVPERKSWLKHIVFYILVASLTIIVMSAITINFSAKLNEGEKCDYNACIEVVNSADPSIAQLLSCTCQCESTQILTEECAQRYECIRNQTCWRLKDK